MVLRPFDEIGDDEEVARVFHPADDIDLIGEALAVVSGGQARRRTVRREALLEPLLRLPAQLPGLVERVAFGGAGKARQERLCGADAERAAHRDLDRRLHGVRQIAKQLGHLRPGLEMVLGRQAAPVLVADEASFGDGEERVVSLVVVAPAEEGLVRGDERQPVAVGKRDELRLDRPLLIEAVALDLDIEPIAEGIRSGPRAAPRRGRAGRRAGARRRAVPTARR